MNAIDVTLARCKGVIALLKDLRQNGGYDSLAIDTTDTDTNIGIGAHDPSLLAQVSATEKVIEKVALDLVKVRIVGPFYPPYYPPIQSCSCSCSSSLSLSFPLSLYNLHSNHPSTSTPSLFFSPLTLPYPTLYYYKYRYWG